jgi:hypothetical protein
MRDRTLGDLDLRAVTRAGGVLPFFATFPVVHGFEAESRDKKVITSRFLHHQHSPHYLFVQHHISAFSIRLYITTSGFVAPLISGFKSSLCVVGYA